jgi:hypothetical protein
MKTKFENEQARAMREANIGQSGQTKKCKCGHLKDEHQPMPDGNIYCQSKDCTCIIRFD